MLSDLVVFSFFQNLLALNPKVEKNASLVPTITTQTNKKHWKRNADKQCSVSDSFTLIRMTKQQHFSLRQCSILCHSFHDWIFMVYQLVFMVIHSVSFVIYLTLVGSYGNLFTVRNLVFMVIFRATHPSHPPFPLHFDSPILVISFILYYLTCIVYAKIILKLGNAK